MTQRFKIYTRTGDQGKTRLVDGRECSKASLRVETYGSFDELNSHLGIVVSQIPEIKKTFSTDKQKSFDLLRNELIQVQHHLFNLGSHAACENEETRKLLPQLHDQWIKELENAIDRMDEELPPLKNFILPGGHQLSAYTHICRTVCRRAERLAVALLEESSKPDLDPKEILFCIRFLNRLSDYLFTLSRWFNLKLEVADQIWSK